MPTERSGGALVFRADCHREVAENGWDEPCKSRGLRTVLWAAGGEILPADPASIDKFGYASLRSERTNALSDADVGGGDPVFANAEGSEAIDPHANHAAVHAMSASPASPRGLGRQPRHHLARVPIRRENWIEDVLDRPVADHKRQTFQQRHPARLEGWQAHGSGQSEVFVR